jgi:sporulation protein YlmC with PRC-barrel domain
MMAATHEISTKWIGHDLLDVNAEKIGTIEDIRLGEAAGGLKWLVVKTGLFGTKKILVPAGEVRAAEGALVVSFTKDRVKAAPGVDANKRFADVEERKICAYYGLDYLVSARAPAEGCVDAEAEASVVSPEPPEGNWT